MNTDPTRRLRPLLVLTLVLVLLAGCFGQPGPLPPPGPIVIASAPSTSAPTATAATPAPSAAPGQLDNVRRLTILYTNDEHGWLTPQPQTKGAPYGGAAGMLGLWQATEGYKAGGPFLVLSGGDMWTGPAISTWFKGDPAVEAMNLMGYQAAVIGNHDFDFGVAVLRRHARESRFPYLSANLVLKGTSDTPDFAIPFTIIDVDGIRAGLIGLSLVGTPRVTNPRNVQDFDFLPYAETLERYVPQVRAAGADLIVVVGHVCSAEMADLAPQAKQLGVDVLTAGHCHERVTQDVNGLPLIEAGDFMQAYVRLVLDVDLIRHAVTGWKADLVTNRPDPAKITPDPAVAQRVAYWQGQTDAALGEVIGYTKTGLAKSSAALSNLVTDAWLAAYPNAQAAVNNAGSLRQDIDAGPISLGDIVSVLPFDDQLVDAAVSGDQLRQNLACCGGAIGGITYRAGKLALINGGPVDPKRTYHVIINDFMANGGDSYKFGKQDPQAYFTGTDWRQPVIDYIRALGSSQAQPLETLIDGKSRN